MDEAKSTFEFLGLTFNTANIISGLIVFAILIGLVFFLSRSITLRPGKKQNILEWLVDFTNGLVKVSIPGKESKGYGLWAFTLFCFIFIANMLGLFAHIEVNGITYVKSPTADPVIPMTFALITLVLAQYSGIKRMGYKEHFKGYLKPVPFFLPINIFEELTNFLTLGIRLFGNIFAGEMLAGLIANMAFSGGVLTFIVAAPIEMFWQGFSIFIGSIQAYVFVTLSSVYVSQKIYEEE
ncbi:F0F1 ATP synthase subunit A [Lactobacillus sp. S2-2]|uniref:F0F1 ATP synthase subunit A n=1 Tax=Lactobacillus sp. S2-2 TaxID=2692917 RepID=UPI001EFFC2FD|nr:F0F1 ATP synthase subunit A [Lactobacillus sp. S2-2]